MQNALKAEIKILCLRAFKKIEQSQKTEEDYKNRFLKRTGVAAATGSTRSHLPVTKHFDPKYCSRHANFLAKTIWFKVLSKTYEPAPAVKYDIPKPGGGSREIMAFSIPDAALANVVLRRTRDRNLKRLSPSSFAYHPEKNVFDAILALKDYDHDGKLFAVQIDFERYFDSIPSWYLKKKIDDERQVSLTPSEKHVFERFLHHRYAKHSDYSRGVFKRRANGTPQGSSVSLLLANLANHDLDSKLSAAAGKFVRYADDVVALCTTYEDAQYLESCFRQHCRISGLVLNSKKSLGIAIISPKNQELRTYPHFDYLGYRFDGDGLTLPEKTKTKIKQKISRLINLYLIHYLTVGFNKDRVGYSPGPYDWDLLGLIFEMKRGLYGGLSEENLEAFVTNGRKLPKMRGLMGFYCLLDDPKPLKEIDGWILSTIRRTMVERNRILQSKYGASCPTPSNRDLAIGSWLSPLAWQGGAPPNARVPSLVRGWRAARKHYFTFGLERVQPPSYGAYGGWDSIFEY